jgi:hypothetical protein
MKKTSYLFVIAMLSLYVSGSFAQLSVKGDLANKIYDGQGKPDSTIFTKNIGKPDSITFTQTDQGYSVAARSVNFSPILWSLPQSSGFSINEGYTVEAKVAVEKSTTNGFIMEVQGVPGKRFQIGIDTAAIYNMTYYPSTDKEVIAHNLDNKGMHTYRIAVDENDMAYVYRDTQPLAMLDVDGTVSSRAVYKGVETLMNDSIIEIHNSFATPPHPSTKYPEEGGFIFALSTESDITYSPWATMGIDTISANVKVGESSLWCANGTSGKVFIKRYVTTPGRYRFSYWSKTRMAWHKYSGSISLVVGEEKQVLVANNQMIPGNLNYNFKSYVFDIPTEGTIEVTLFNNPGAACHFWLDDMKLERVENESYVCFGKDNEVGGETFTIGAFAYDMTGAYAPDTESGVHIIHGEEANIAVVQSGSRSVNVKYELSKDEVVVMQLIDMTGRIQEIRKIESHVGKNSMTLNTPASGIYLLKFISSETTAAVKFVVQ